MIAVFQSSNDLVGAITPYILTQVTSIWAEFNGAVRYQCLRTHLWYWSSVIDNLSHEGSLRIVEVGIVRMRDSFEAVGALDRDSS